MVQGLYNVHIVYNFVYSITTEEFTLYKYLLVIIIIIIITRVKKVTKRLLSKLTEDL